MNIDNIKLVRDHIAALPPERFKMAHYLSEGGHEHPAIAAENMPISLALTECGTAACIGGWALAVLAPGLTAEVWIDAEAGKLFGLHRDQARALFIPVRVLSTITIPQAVAVLDHLIETGKVDWRVAEQVAA